MDLWARWCCMPLGRSQWQSAVSRQKHEPQFVSVFPRRVFGLPNRGLAAGVGNELQIWRSIFTDRSAYADQTIVATGSITALATFTPNKSVEYTGARQNDLFRHHQDPLVLREHPRVGGLYRSILQLLKLVSTTSNTVRNSPLVLTDR